MASRSRPALRLYAGAAARQHIQRHGVQPQHIGVIAGAAGGPKGLILGALDRFIFGHWLPQSTQPVALVGASIGAWRLASACLPDPEAALRAFEQAYVHQDFALGPGQRAPRPAEVSAVFARNVHAFYAGQLDALLQHPRYALHIVTARGRGLLGRDTPLRRTLGFAGAWASNAVARRALGLWLQRVVFSSARSDGPAALPFATADLPTVQHALTVHNFEAALCASCSIPFALQAVAQIAGAPDGAYWDGGLTDYQLHLHYADRARPDAPLVLYPHFLPQLVPGWLDKPMRWRHQATPALSPVLVLAPDPDWVRTLPGGKLPDRSDFYRYAADLPARVRAWHAATAAAEQLADDWARWLAAPDVRQVLPLP
ncbi:MAG: hypothetical protein Fur007_21270 [Rhodoferax sp.]